MTLSAFLAIQTAGILFLAGQAGGLSLSASSALLGASFAVDFALLAFSNRGAERRARKNRLLGELASEVNRAILLNEEEDKIFSTILDYAFRILENVNLGSVLSFNEEGYLVIAASQGFSEDFVKDFRLRLEDSFQYRQSGGKIREAMIIAPETIRGYSDRLDSSKREYKSIISAPLFVGGKLYGFLNVDSVRAGLFGPEDLELLKKFASQIEVCLLARERYRASLAKTKVDGLTGFLSRAWFEQLAGHSLEHARRYGESLTLGMFDVDGLKQVNDSLGHPAGDMLLGAVAAAIGQTARKSDAIGRYGGDEFVAIYYATDAATMVAQAERKLAELTASGLSFAGRKVRASFCFGFADYPREAGDLEGLIAMADARLYAMKAARKTDGVAAQG